MQFRRRIRRRRRRRRLRCDVRLLSQILLELRGRAPPPRRLRDGGELVGEEQFGGGEHAVDPRLHQTLPQMPPLHREKPRLQLDDMSPPCGFRFCWLCGQDSRFHSRCNKYGGPAAGYEKNAKREKARKDLQRYTHYYERWHANEQSRKAAVKDLKTWRDDDGVSKLGEAQAEAPAQLQFVTKAWEQIAECRRVLKWSYAYGYYMEREAPKKVALFEHSQGEAEKQLERLHHCVEKEMGEYLRRPREDFQEFRVRVVDLTVVTGNYFENLVRDLENNRAEVVGGRRRNGLEKKKKKDDDERKGLEKKRKKKDDDERNVPRKRATYAFRFSRN
ncbi:probable E3 ubiquitin-protein ligase ARI8 [Salvia miltiorrhiza]|uniref:probable E3 ubiquitin-protein ligase ARI8 n=1 Tax=Salvia miltiorrhiza TaxID=226208 RepID=UPI0025AD9257|nr:probable E3 ubiquitin-protein ligase ARI8 [Salvia miltiorrhiza]